MKKQEQKEELERLNLYVSKRTVDKLDSLRGQDISRSALIRLILDQGVQQLQRKGLQLNLFD